jgi:hypothetical protein
MVWRLDFTSWIETVELVMSDLLLVPDTGLSQC